MHKQITILSSIIMRSSGKEGDGIGVAAQKLLLTLSAVKKIKHRTRTGKKVSFDDHEGIIAEGDEGALDDVMERRMEMLNIASLTSVEDNPSDKQTNFQMEYTHVRNNWTRFIGFPMQYLLLVSMIFLFIASSSV